MTTRERPSATGVELGEMRPDELDEAAALLSLVYRDNPLALSFLGDDPERRFKVNAVVQAFRIGAMAPPPIVGRINGGLVGVCGFETPTPNEPSPEALQDFLVSLDSAGVLKRAQQMIGDFREGGLSGDHWHLGPVAVATEAQGQGIGTLMVDEFCARLDAVQGTAVLETDLERNVRLYERWGFETQHIRPVIDVPMWFMLRPAKT